MFSRLVLRAARVTPTSAVGRPLALARPSITPVFQALSARSYAAGGPDVGASYKNVEARILDIFRTFDKVNQDNLTTEASFTKDLGLDSLDAVEVVMAIEEEFMVEIPDAEADEIKTVKDAIDYIIACPEAGPH